MSRAKSMKRCHAGAALVPICSMSSRWRPLFERPGSGPDPARAAKKKTSSTTDPALATHLLQKRIPRLGKQIRNVTDQRSHSQWSQYEKSAGHYQQSDVDEKQQFVKNILARCRPDRVLDIGANTGTYSLLAADAGAKVVSLDSDSAALEVLWRTAAKQKKPITAMVAEHRPSHSRGRMAQSRALFIARPPNRRIRPRSRCLQLFII